MKKVLEYRPEIDGLRAFAVISVIIYHAEISLRGFDLVKGGFLGVDIFFVISGFLITRIILTEYFFGSKFSLLKFYERRARRILPAFFFIIICIFPFAWNLLLPEQLVNFSESVISSIFFASNVFWNLTLQEYGAESALLKPLLHTWSLSLEEQFYLIYPLLILFVLKYLRSHLISVIMVVLIVSLQFAEFFTPINQSFSFYMLPSRFWELAAGGLIASISIMYPANNDNFFYKVMPAIGLALLVHSVLFIDFNEVHPGFVTTIPIVGVMLIIYFSREEELVTKVLSSKVIVGIGLISYSLYLWHYPIFAFGRYLETNPGWSNKIVWIFLSFVLAAITYFLIERPFRNKSILSTKVVLVMLLIGFSIIVGVSYFWIYNKGFTKRLGYLNSIRSSYNRVWVNKDGVKCHSGGGGRQPEFLLDESCVFNYSNDSKYLIVIGDSHAAALSENLRMIAEINSYNFIQLTQAGCAHIFDYGTKSCRDRSRQMIGFLEKYPNSIVVYNSRIPLFIESEKFINEKGESEDNYQSVSLEVKNREFPKKSRAVTKTLEALQSAAGKLVIVYPVPEQGFHVKDKLFKNYRLATGREDLPIITTSYSKFKERVKRSYQVLDRISGDNVLRVYPEAVFCGETTGRCLVADRDKVYFASDNHVSPLGAALIVEKVSQVLSLNTPIN